jgi:hypothetical protein
MEIPAAAKVCPHCRKKQGMGFFLKIILLFFGFLVLSKIGIFSSPSSSKKVSVAPSPAEKAQTDKRTAGEVKSLTVRGKTIKVGDTSDHVVTILKSNDIVNQTVSKDPSNPNSLLVIKHFKVKGKNFTIHFGRIQDPGPYKVIKIIADENKAQTKTITEDLSKPPSKKIKTLSDFELSEFCHRYLCQKDASWHLRNGDTNHTYKSSVKHLSVEVSTKGSIVTGLGLMFYERPKLSAEEYDIISTLLRSTDKSVKHSKTLSFIKQNVENKVCDTCSVQPHAKSTTDGKFRIWAGKSGWDQIISFKRVEDTEM